MSFVLDTSITMAWLFEDETCKRSEEVLARFEAERALVPDLWLLEVANVLLVGERKKRVAEAQSRRFVSLLNDLPIEIAPPTAQDVFGDTLSLAREHGLSSYDAAYLDLAIRRGVALATLDKKLQQTAKRIGVEVI